MEIKTRIKNNAYAVHFSLVNAKKEIGRVYLYILRNDLHRKPFGFIEDVFIEEEYRGQKLGARLIKTALAEARKRGCYKVITTSRYGRSKLHHYYEGVGLKKHGFEFRRDFLS